MYYLRSQYHHPQAQKMALRVRVIRRWILALALVYFCFGVNGDDEESEAQTGGGGGGVGDPAQIVSKALLCFNNKYIYKSCEETCRLNESGNLDVPPEKADEFCEGPCLTETNLVLSCLDNIFTNFVFYNRATIQDIKDTIQAACGYGPERGHFDVAEHMKVEESRTEKANNHILLGLGLIITGRLLLLN